MRVSVLWTVIPLAACSSGIQGVWMIEVPMAAEDECADSIDHNFNGATAVEDDGSIPGGLQIDETSEASPSLIVVAIEQLSGTNATLLVGNNIYPGTKTDTGWSFSWEQVGESSRDESVANYSYSLQSTASSLTTWTVSAEGDLLSADVEAESSQERAWSEADMWNEEAQGFVSSSQIPSAAFLTVEREGNTLPATNSVDREECDSTCELTVTTTCSGATELTGTRTGYEIEDMGDKAINAGQAGGVI